MTSVIYGRAPVAFVLLKRIKNTKSEEEMLLCFKDLLFALKVLSDSLICLSVAFIFGIRND